jgi:hypothetical protein
LAWDLLNSGTEQVDIMQNSNAKLQLSSRLSPRAKRAFLRVPAGQRVRVLLNVSASANLAELKQSLEELGGDVTSMSAETHSVGAAVPSETLPQVASMREVTYVDAAAVFTA